MIGILYEISESDNHHLNPVIESLNLLQNANEKVTANSGFTLENFLPLDTSAFYRYEGSLTTPGCFEIVTWSVLEETQTVSEKQLQNLRSILDSEGVPMGNNFRPVQPLNGRRVVKSKRHHDSFTTKTPTHVSSSNELWYYNLVPGWAVVLIVLATAANVGVLVFLLTRRKYSSFTHTSVPTEEFGK